MALPDVSPSRLGQANAGGSASALFLTRWSGEVLDVFQNETKFIDKSYIQQIVNSNAAQFDYFANDGEAYYHTPGGMIDPKVVNHNKTTITTDGLLIAPRFIANIDEAMANWNARARYTKEVGRTLARKMDTNIAQVGILAARHAAMITGGQAGEQLFSVDPDSVDPEDDASVYAKLFDAQTALDEKNVPEDDRYAFLRPAQFSKLVRGLTAIDRDYVLDNGSVATGKVYELAGFTLVKTNQLPSTNIASGPSAYQGDFSDTVALCMHRDAVGTVKLIDLQVEMEYSTWHQGTLVVSKYAMGHGILRPEYAVELTEAAS